VTFGQPLTRQQYEAARWIAEPLRLYDCCQESDGACAVLVTTSELARRLPTAPIQVLAAQQGGNTGWYAGGLGAHTMPAHDYGSGNMAQLAARLYDRAGVHPLDVDFAQLYDHFSPAVLLGLEDFGLCRVGQAAHFVCDGGIRHGGALPVNTAGGLLSEAYVHGLNLVVEAVRQLRGQSTRQVPGARVGLVTAGAGSVPTSAALLAS
jgi:acetyl-CoA acetyltransferase